MTDLELCMRLTEQVVAAVHDDAADMDRMFSLMVARDQVFFRLGPEDTVTFLEWSKQAEARV